MSQVPTVGRRMWFVSSDEMNEEMGFESLSDQPFDAGVIHVNQDGTVNLLVADHVGHIEALSSIEVFQGDYVVGEVPENHVCWMPYQKKQYEQQRVL